MFRRAARTQCQGQADKFEGQRHEGVQGIFARDHARNLSLQEIALMALFGIDIALILIVASILIKGLL